MRRNEIEALLPSVLQRTIAPGAPLATLLQIMDDLHAPAEEILAGLERFFNAYGTPDEFVPYLASWVDLERFLEESPTGEAASRVFVPGVGLLRELIVHAAYLSKWRGTQHGLLRFLEVATGVEGFMVEEETVDEEGRRRPFHLRVVAPAAAQPFATLVRRIVEQEKPAYVTAELVFGE